MSLRDNTSLVVGLLVPLTAAWLGGCRTDVSLGGIGSNAGSGAANSGGSDAGGAAGSSSAGGAAGIGGTAGSSAGGSGTNCEPEAFDATGQWSGLIDGEFAYIVLNVDSIDHYWDQAMPSIGDGCHEYREHFGEWAQQGDQVTALLKTGRVTVKYCTDTSLNFGPVDMPAEEVADFDFKHWNVSRGHTTPDGRLSLGHGLTYVGSGCPTDLVGVWTDSWPNGPEITKTQTLTFASDGSFIDETVRDISTSAFDQPGCVETTRLLGSYSQMGSGTFNVTYDTKEYAVVGCANPDQDVAFSVLPPPQPTTQSSFILNRSRLVLHPNAYDRQ